MTQMLNVKDPSGRTTPSNIDVYWPDWSDTDGHTLGDAREDYYEKYYREQVVEEEEGRLFAEGLRYSP